MNKCVKRLAAAVLACASAVACSRQATEHKVVMVEASDAAMNAAIAHARQTLPGFLALAANPPAGTGDYKLKVLVTDGDANEHFWIIPFEVTATGFRGTLANTPNTVRNVESGQVIEFDRLRITDWGYVRDGKQVGSFTVCVMLTHVPKAEADAMRRDYGFTC